MRDQVGADAGAWKCEHLLKEEVGSGSSSRSTKGEDLRRAKAEGCGLGCERAAQTRRDEQQGRAPRSWRYENANARNVLGEL